MFTQSKLVFARAWAAPATLAPDDAALIAAHLPNLDVADVPRRSYLRPRALGPEAHLRPRRRRGLRRRAHRSTTTGRPSSTRSPRAARLGETLDRAALRRAARRPDAVGRSPRHARRLRPRRTLRRLLRAHHAREPRLARRAGACRSSRRPRAQTHPLRSIRARAVLAGRARACSTATRGRRPSSRCVDEAVPPQVASPDARVAGRRFAEWELPTTNPWVRYFKFTLLSALDDRAERRRAARRGAARARSHQARARGQPASPTAGCLPTRCGSSICAAPRRWRSAPRSRATRPAGVALVPTFNNWPAENELIPAEETLAAMVDDAAASARRRSERSTPGLPARRVAPRLPRRAPPTTTSTTATCSRRAICPTPRRCAGRHPPHHLRRRAASATATVEEDDLHETFLEYQRAGIAISMVDVSALERLVADAWDEVFQTTPYACSRASPSSTSRASTSARAAASAASTPRAELGPHRRRAWTGHGGYGGWHGGHGWWGVETRGLARAHRPGPARPHRAGPARPDRAGPARPHRAGPARPHRAGPARPDRAGPARPTGRAPRDLTVLAQRDLIVLAQRDLTMRAQRDLTVLAQRDLTVLAQRDLTVLAQRDLNRRPRETLSVPALRDPQRAGPARPHPPAAPPREQGGERERWSARRRRDHSQRPTQGRRVRPGSARIPSKCISRRVDVLTSVVHIPIHFDDQHARVGSRSRRTRSSSDAVRRPPEPIGSRSPRPARGAGGRGGEVSRAGSVRVSRLGGTSPDGGWNEPQPRVGRAPTAGGTSPDGGWNAADRLGRAPMAGGTSPDGGWNEPRWRVGRAPMAGGTSPNRGGRAPMAGGTSPNRGWDEPRWRVDEPRWRWNEPQPLVERAPTAGGTSPDGGWNELRSRVERAPMAGWEMSPDGGWNELRSRVYERQPLVVRAPTTGGTTPNRW